MLFLILFKIKINILLLNSSVLGGAYNYFELLGDGASNPAKAPMAAEPIAVKIVGTFSSSVIFPLNIKTITPQIIIKIQSPNDNTIIL